MGKTFATVKNEIFLITVRKYGNPSVDERITVLLVPLKFLLAKQYRDIKQRLRI